MRANFGNMMTGPGHAANMQRSRPRSKIIVKSAASRGGGMVKVLMTRQARSEASAD